MLSWFFYSLRVKEDVLVDKLGLDAAIFIRFIKMCRNITFVLSLLICGVGIPINVHYNMISSSSDSLARLKDAFILMTPSLITGLPVVAHIVLTYFVDIVVAVFLWINLKKVIQLRRNVFSSPEYQRQLFLRTLTVSEIPKNYRSDDGLVQLMRSWSKRIKGSQEIQQVKVGRDSKAVTELIERHTETVYKLESVLAKYLKNPEKLPAQRPTCRPFKEDRASFPTRKVDAIDYYGKRMKALEDKISSARDVIDENVALGFGFVSYYSQQDCHEVAKDLGSAKQRRRGKVLVQLASRPSDIIWKNIILSRVERGSKQFWGNLLYITLLILWIVPNAFIGCFITDLSRIGQLWPAFQRFLDGNPTLFAIIQGFLSPMVTALIFLILPIIMRRMSQFQGKITKNEREKDVTLKLYIFFFFNNFFVVTIIGVAWNIGAQIVSFIDGSEGDLTVGRAWSELRFGQQIVPAIINASSFWVMYLIRANIAGVVDLLQLVSLSWKSFQKHFMSPTPRQIIQWTAPEPYLFATNYNWVMFYTTIGLCFTSIQPIIMPILCLYLTASVIFKKYSLMYMFVTKVESDGMCWPLVHHCIVFATGFGNLMMLSVVWIKGDWKMAAGVAPAIAAVVIFWIFSSREIRNKFDYFIPDESERQKIAEQNEFNKKGWDEASSYKLSERYQNPAINKRLSVPMVAAKAQYILPTVCNFLHQGMHDDDEYIMGYEHNKRGEPTPFGDDQEILSEESPANRASNLTGMAVFDIVPEDEMNFANAPTAFREEAVPYAANNFGVPDKESLKYTNSHESHDELQGEFQREAPDIHLNGVSYSDENHDGYPYEKPVYPSRAYNDGYHGYEYDPNDLSRVETQYSGYEPNWNQNSGLHDISDHEDTPYPSTMWRSESSHDLRPVPSPLYDGNSDLGVVQNTFSRRPSSTDDGASDRQRLL